LKQEKQEKQEKQAAAQLLEYHHRILVQSDSIYLRYMTSMNQEAIQLV